MRLENLQLFFLLLVSAALAFGQGPKIGFIEVFGGQKATTDKLIAALNVKVGDPLPKSKTDLEEHILNTSDVVRVEVTAVCCEQAKAILYIGIQEKGMEGFVLRDDPSGNAELPAAIVEAFAGFTEAMSDVRGADAVQDVAQGHGLVKSPKARAFQLNFVKLAGANQPRIEEVLKGSVSPEQRAIAAYVLGYSPNKKQIVNSLELALRDSDESVRNNALHSLAAIAAFAVKNPAAGIAIEPVRLIEMLRSTSFSDRNKAATTLVSMSERRDAKVLDPIREKAVGEITEMARWKSLEYALPAYILLGRAAGIEEKRLRDAWAAGNREAIITEATEALKSKKKLFTGVPWPLGVQSAQQDRQK